MSKRSLHSPDTGWAGPANNVSQDTPFAAIRKLAIGHNGVEGLPQLHPYSVRSSNNTTGSRALGSTYTNILLKGLAQEQVVTYLQQRQEASFVSPTIHGLTFVYAAHGWQNLALDLSRVFHAPAFWASVYDSDVFKYALYADGILLDTYTSDPRPYDEGNEEEDEQSFDDTSMGKAELSSTAVEPEGGNAHVLCAIFGAERAVAQVEAVLRPKPTDPRDLTSFADYRHWYLAEALGWPPRPCRTGYRYLLRDGVEADLEATFGGLPVKTNGDDSGVLRPWETPSPLWRPRFSS